MIVILGVALLLFFKDKIKNCITVIRFDLKKNTSSHIEIKDCDVEDLYCNDKIVFDYIFDHMINPIGIKDRVTYIKEKDQRNIRLLPGQYDYRALFLLVIKQLRENEWIETNELWDYIWSTF